MKLYECTTYDHKIHRMSTFLNQYFTLPFLCGNLRLSSIKCLLVLIYLQFHGRTRIFYDNQLMHYATSIRYPIK
jgi:hypothetical protein